MKNFMTLLALLAISTFVSCNGVEDEDWYDNYPDNDTPADTQAETDTEPADQTDTADSEPAEQEDTADSEPADPTDTADSEPADPTTDEDVEPMTDEDIEPMTDEDIEPLTDEDIEPLTDEDIEPLTDEDIEPLTDEDVEPTDDDVPAYPECEQITINSLKYKNFNTSDVNFMYNVVTAEFDEYDFVLQIKNKDNSLPTVVDLSNFAPNNCNSSKQAFVSLKIMDLDGTSYFQAAGKIDLTSLNTSNGALSAPIVERIKLVEYEIDDALFEFKQPVENGQCLEIMNDSLYFSGN